MKIREIIKNLIVLTISLFILTAANNSYAEKITGNRTADRIIFLILENNMMDENQNTNSRAARYFCEFFNPRNPSICQRSAILGSADPRSFSPLSLAEGLCLAGNGSRPTVCQRAAILGPADARSFSPLSLAEGLCLAGNGSRPTVCQRAAILEHFDLNPLSLAEGLCLAGNGSWPPVCRRSAILGSADPRSFSPLSLAEGLCLAGNGSRPTVCQRAGLTALGGPAFSLEDAILALPQDDRSWAWDQFQDQRGVLVWACRGMQTGQFAFHVRCRDQPQHDMTWPGR